MWHATTVWPQTFNTGVRDSQEPGMSGKLVSCHLLPCLYRFLLTQTSFTYQKKNQWNFSCQHCLAGEEKSFRTAYSMECFKHPPAVQSGHLTGPSHALHRWRGWIMFSSACHWWIAVSKVTRVVEWTGTPLRRLTASWAAVNSETSGSWVHINLEYGHLLKSNTSHAQTQQSKANLMTRCGCDVVQVSLIRTFSAQVILALSLHGKTGILKVPILTAQ